MEKIEITSSPFYSWSFCSQYDGLCFSKFISWYFCKRVIIGAILKVSLTKNFEGKHGESTIKQKSLLQEFSVPWICFWALWEGATSCIVYFPNLFDHNLRDPHFYPHRRVEKKKSYFFAFKSFFIPPPISKLSSALRAPVFIFRNCKVPTSLPIFCVFNTSSFQTSQTFPVKFEIPIIDIGFSNPFVPRWHSGLNPHWLGEERRGHREKGYAQKGKKCKFQ